MMKLPVKIGLLLFVCGSCTALNASETTDDSDKPSLEFLEFLGSFETDNGEWLDPMEIEAMLKLKPQQTTIKEPRDE